MNEERNVAIVTGGGRGIGLGISKCLASAGYDLAIVGVRDEEAVAEPLRELESLGAATVYCQADIGDAEARTKMFDAALARFGKVNMLVNNAGVAPKVRMDILEATEESYERVMRINLQGSYFLTQLVANHLVGLKEANPGFFACIVNISSISATVASPSRGEYCLSKAGIAMATRLWAARLGEYDIPVYEVRPGLVMTDMTAGVKEKYDKLIDEGLCRQKRWGYPEDIGKAVAALARGDMPYSTGQVVMVDGGLTVQAL